MILNYLKIAFRNLIRNKTYSIINIAGLATGIAVSVLILLFVMHELSYDKYHSNYKQIFRVVQSQIIGQEELQFASFPSDFAPTLKARNPHIKDYVRWMSQHGNVVMKNPDRPERMFYEKEILFADPSLLRIFSFPLKKGDINYALRKPNSVIISREMALKYFADTDPIGKVLLVEGKLVLQVTGVTEDLPSNSSFHFDFLLPLETFPALNGVDKSKWAAGGSFNIYLLLNSENRAASVEEDINKTFSKTAGSNEQFSYSLENLSLVHLSKDLRNPGKTKLVYVFAGIAILIILLAVVNYVSLTTARATLRAKEVGVRKFIGSGRIGLIKQFYIESLLLCVLAFLLAGLLIEFFRQPFYQLLDLRIDISFILSPEFLGFLLFLFCLIVLIAGGYPALMISGFAPLDIIKGKVAGKYSGASVRKLLTVFQFAISTTLIICSVIVRNQISYMQNRDLGLYKDQVLSIPVDHDTIQNLFAFKNELSHYTGVQSVSIADLGLFRSYNIWSIKHWRTKEKIKLYYIVTDADFVKTLGIKWKMAPVPGTFTSRKHVLLNEAAVSAFEIEKTPLGKSINDLDEVAGVIRDFQFISPRDGIKPMALMIEPDPLSFDKEAGSRGVLYARLDPKAEVSANIQIIKQRFEKYFPGRPFEYYFLDDALDQTIKTEVRMGKMFNIFTLLAIFIASIGLFGLVTFAAEVRTREIGIRKVLGASVGRIVALISQDFARLIMISTVGAIPFAWYFMNKWLQDFQYRIKISWWRFAAGAALAITIAFITVSFQSIKAALTNPVKSLKSE
ncbi:ABC transporter permease [Dyadobacter crusticola]|uniref:ABC transporter permease n=1 Tax=Dyadobacter crusticola TaxID=292407 RepID=UPI0004E0B3DC|nr:ABC transporter permease [Dyadobacter crusticola]